MVNVNCRRQHVQQHTVSPTHFHISRDPAGVCMQLQLRRGWSALFVDPSVHFLDNLSTQFTLRTAMTAAFQG